VSQTRTGIQEKEVAEAACAGVPGSVGKAVTRWGYAEFEYDAVSDTFRQGTAFDEAAQERR